MMEEDEVNEIAMINQYMHNFMGSYPGAIMAGYSWREFANRHKREMEVKWLNRLYEKEERLKSPLECVEPCYVNLPYYL